MEGRRILEMNISAELLFTIITNLIAIGVFIGVYKTTINFMQQQIVDLKDEMHKYNNVLTRLAVAENTLKSLHHRIDDLEINK